MGISTKSSDELLSASFSLYANPGAYALLLGAGVSASSGVLTAWPLLMDLVSQVAALEGETPEDPESWYEERFGIAPTYEGVLEQLGPTPHERQRLLRGYFERDEEDVEAERKLPTPAHRAIARLVKTGAVRVIVTMNFDHLIEQAIRVEGLEPTVIASPADVKGMAPLHTLECCVIHLHGDYLHPTSMRNTVEELGDYDPATQKLLERILEDYGLIVAGWSARYDPALRETIACHYSTRFTMTWIERGSSTEEATHLRTLKNGALVTADADTAFGHLADGVAALKTRRSRHPLTIPVAVETAKRELAGRPVAIGLHDTLRQELEQLHDRPEFYVRDEKDSDPYAELVERAEEATLLPAALLATLAYWGRPETDRWWLTEVPRFAVGADGGGTVRLLHLRIISGSMLFYAAGIAAVAAQRFDLLGQLFAARRPNRWNGEFETLAQALDSSASYEGIADRDTRLHRKLAPLLQETLQIGREPLEDAWQMFELLRIGIPVTRSPAFEQLRDDFFQADAALRDADRVVRCAEEAGGAADQEEQAARHEAWQERDRVIGQVGRRANIGRPHILAGMREMHDNWAPTPLIRRMIDDLELEADDNPIVSDELFYTSDDALISVHAVSAQLGALARELSDRLLPEGVGFVSRHVWLDSGQPPNSIDPSVG